MAGDWLKVEMDTPDKPEIGFIARTCGVTPPVAFEAWFRLWCWFDRQTDTGEVQFFTAGDADRIARLPGIGDALSTDQGCGWVTFHARGATIVNWDNHNGCSAKKRALTNKRVSHWREKRGPHGPPPMPRNAPAPDCEAYTPNSAIRLKGPPRNAASVTPCNASVTQAALQM